MRLLDCTLRDGANLVGTGFSAHITELILKGLIENGIDLIEMGNAEGLGAYDKETVKNSLSDEEYLKLAAPYTSRAEIGMFMLTANCSAVQIGKAAKAGLKFIRLGQNAGALGSAPDAIRMVKSFGLKARFALMKSYLLTPEALAEEVCRLADQGLDAATIMDSAGTMLPTEVGEYVSVLKQKTGLSIGFHGHNNLGLSAANALTAWEHGVDTLDCGLMGMARSAGNLPTEVIAALLKRKGLDIANTFGLMHFIEDELLPETQSFYACPIKPLDLLYGYSGCHSKFGKTFARIAGEMGVDVYELICETSEKDRRAPTETLMRETAETLRRRGCATL